MTSDLRPAARGQRTVFLDRDGTMIHETGYLSRLEDVRWFPGAMDAIRLLKRAGYLVCVVTNQGGIGLGLFDDAFVRSVHAAMQLELVASGAAVDGWYYCPHHPNAVSEALRTPCGCRKPGRAMIDAACRDHEIDLARSWVIGDRDVDVRMAHAVGARGVLVTSGHGARDLARLGRALPEGTLVVADLTEAVAEVLTQ
jgi:D-glycero-D-manno-heptose 1,7-bisphosphate phosphatase